MPVPPYLLAHDGIRAHGKQAQADAGEGIHRRCDHRDGVEFLSFLQTK
jgi:hypothetical protein